MPNIVTTVGNAPIPFSGYGAGATARPRGRMMRSFGFGPSFLGSADMVSLVKEALGRYQNAIDTADQACNAQSGLFQRAFNWVTGNTSTVSVCSAAAQMHLNFDAYTEKVNDPNTTDAQLAEILGFVNQETDVSDLVALANATSAGSVLVNATLNAPGTVVGAAAKGVEQVGTGILGNIPWWVFVGGALWLAVELGWKPLGIKKAP